MKTSFLSTLSKGLSGENFPQNPMQFLPVCRCSLFGIRRLRRRFSFFVWSWTSVSAGQRGAHLLSSRNSEFTSFSLAQEDRFVEACQMHCHIEYMADVLTVGDLEEWVALVDKLMQDGNIAFLQEYTARKKKKYRKLHSHWNNFWIGY